MIRTLLALATLAAVPAAALAQAAPDASPNFSGVTVQAPPQNPYVIRLDVTGKSEGEIRKMISQASNVACDHAFRAERANMTYMPLCIYDARDGGLQQLASLMDRRRQGLPVQLAIAANIVTR